MNWVGRGARYDFGLGSIGFSSLEETLWVFLCCGGRSFDGALFELACIRQMDT